tara:strand:+ start:1145 stop:1477 length:333 start_codon:yes stop_codon:yes gene_type:complete
MDRKFTITSPKACELLKEYKELSVKVSNLQDQISALEEERNKLAMKGQKAKDKLAPIVDELTKAELGEFEVVVNISRSKVDGELEVDISNALQQFKDAYRKKKLAPEETK